MTLSGKIRVAVLFGGRSAEHEVSLQSAANVIQYLDTTQFDVIPVGIDRQGNWFLGNDIFKKSLEQNTVPKLHDDNHAWFTPEWVGKAVAKTDTTILPKGHAFDVIFPVMHGTFCEDGTLQGLLELADLPYVGCGVLASAVGMDKDVAKRLALQAGIPVGAYVAIKLAQWQKHSDTLLREINDSIKLPVFVKPANAGSSIGITKAKTADQLQAAIQHAFQFDTKVLVEKAINVQELEIAVLESLEPGTDPIVSVVGEIKPTHEFYSYDAKYVDADGAELFIPAAVSEDIKEQAQIMAKTIFQALECEGMARIDLFLDKDTNQLYFNELNTIPGFTQISMYPKLMQASGVSYADLLTHLISLALKRQKNKNALIRDYAG